ncbi:MAG: septum formation initiator family protein [Bacteroidaceae bacterium]|jgi:cell division protein FtsL|nr:septum formation initiator family protein [Bacteroidaceae bacterium]MBP5691512.1 septum formation initiator family protein [Bacteroidaceae bacterium]
MMDNGFLPQLKGFIGRYKYWIVLVLFLLIVLVASENSMVKRVVQKREIHELQEQLRRSSEQKQQNEMMLNELSNDSLVIDRIAREKYNMHREDEDLFLENVR